MNRPLVFKIRVHAVTHETECSLNLTYQPFKVNSTTCDDKSDIGILVFWTLTRQVCDYCKILLKDQGPDYEDYREFCHAIMTF
jgi:hypothetical protein